MGKTNILTQKVNFIISVLFMGSVTLLAIITMLEADEKDNPIANAFASVIVKEEI